MPTEEPADSELYTVTDNKGQAVASKNTKNAEKTWFFQSWAPS
jgi:hypothetical protein